MGRFETWDEMFARYKGMGGGDTNARHQPQAPSENKRHEIKEYGSGAQRLAGHKLQNLEWAIR